MLLGLSELWCVWKLPFLLKAAGAFRFTKKKCEEKGWLSQVLVKS